MVQVRHRPNRVVGRNHLSQVAVRAAVGAIGSSGCTGQVIPLDPTREDQASPRIRTSQMFYENLIHGMSFPDCLHVPSRAINFTPL